MEGALIILAVTVAIGVILWLWEKARGGTPLHHHSPDVTASKTEEDYQAEASPSRVSPPAVCCGLHAICEKTGQINEPPVYYDDEDLDRYIGRAADEYADEEIEEFRDVLLTLLPSDAPGWTVSLEKRRINLPTELQPELELLLAEIKTANHNL